MKLGNILWAVSIVLYILAVFLGVSLPVHAQLVKTPGWHKIPATALCGGPENSAYIDPDNFPANLGPYTSYGTNNVGTATCADGFRDSNSAAYDTTRHRMIYWGGGHVGWWRNDVWSLEMTQVGTGTKNNFGVVSPLYHLDYSANQNSCANTGPASATITNTNGSVCNYDSTGALNGVLALDKCVYVAGCVPTRVTPGTVHDYEALTYSPFNDEVVLLGGGGTAPRGNGNNNGWTLAMNSVLPSCAPTGTGQGCDPVWTSLGNIANNNFFIDSGNVGKVAVYDPNSQGIWMQTQGNLWFFNPSTGTITQKSTNGNGYHFSGAFDSYHNYFIFVGLPSEGGIRYINIGAGGSYPFVNPTTTGCTAFLNAANPQYPGVVWDSVDRRIVIFPNASGGTLYILDPETWTCTTESYSPAGPDTPICASPCGQQGTFNHFAYDPGLDVFVLWNDPNNDAWYLHRRRGEHLKH